MILNSHKTVRVFLIFIFLNFQSVAQVKKTKDKSLSLVDYNKLSEVKSSLKEKQFSVSYRILLKQADSALQEGPFSVTQKTQIPPSGTKHDYLSIGPYWWPDSEKPDGLPWIRRDGEVNPLTRENTTDERTKDNMFQNTNTLALAYFFSDNKKYADKALELLKAWFLNPDSKMNPNLDFAQGIPGINTGRGIGIIEFAGITKIITAIEILELNEVMDTETSTGLRLWFSEYLNWLQTSENGMFEKNTKNNHATWYDVQIVSILVFLNKEAEAKQVLEMVKTERITTQIAPNGAQPHELARTKALSYSTMNLKGFTELAVLGKKLDVDLWNFESETGAGIKKAYEFLKPYVLTEKVWDYKQIGDKNKAIEGLKDLFLFAGSQFNVFEYCGIEAQAKSAPSLLYNCN